MPTKLTPLSSLVACLVILSCNTTNYTTQKHYFSDEYAITKITAPEFPFQGKMNDNPIRIDFPKQGQFVIYLSENQCSGEYEANTDGSISFTRTNCTPQCCDSDWDLYILTLIKKATRYTSGKKKPLILYIDDDNYLQLESGQFSL